MTLGSTTNNPSSSNLMGLLLAPLNGFGHKLHCKHSCLQLLRLLVNAVFQVQNVLAHRICRLFLQVDNFRITSIWYKPPVVWPSRSLSESLWSLSDSSVIFLRICSWIFCCSSSTSLQRQWAGGDNIYNGNVPGIGVARILTKHLFRPFGCIFVSQCHPILKIRNN